MCDLKVVAMFKDMSKLFEYFPIAHYTIYILAEVQNTDIMYFWY